MNIARVYNLVCTLSQSEMPRAKIAQTVNMSVPKASMNKNKVIGIYHRLRTELHDYVVNVSNTKRHRKVIRYDLFEYIRANCPQGTSYIHWVSDPAVRAKIDELFVSKSKAEDAVKKLQKEHDAMVVRCKTNVDLLLAEDDEVYSENLFDDPETLSLENDDKEANPEDGEGKDAPKPKPRSRPNRPKEDKPRPLVEDIRDDERQLDFVKPFANPVSFFDSGAFVCMNIGDELTEEHGKTMVCGNPIDTFGPKFCPACMKLFRQTPYTDSQREKSARRYISSPSKLIGFTRG